MTRLRLLRPLLAALMIASSVAAGAAVRFDEAFADSTLCMRVAFKAGRDTAWGRIDSLRMTPQWWGRRVNLDTLHLPEPMRITVTDSASGRTLYTHSKYFALEPAPHPLTTTVQVPVPKRPAIVKVSIGAPQGPGRRSRLEAEYALSSAMLASMPVYTRADAPEFVMLRQAARRDSSLTIAIVPEGFTADEMPRFLQLAQQLDSALMTEQVFARNADVLNIAAVLAPSPQSGVNHPSAGIHVNTLLGAHFDSYGIDRLLTMPQSSKLGDMLCGLPNTHVLIIANSTTYGGSGSGNDYCIGTLDPYWWLQVLIHEFGHSFGHLGDEYEGGVSEEYLGDDDQAPGPRGMREPREPMEPNVTNLVDFGSKWQHLIDSGEASLIEGANYHSKGYWRGCEHCLMRATGDLHFCPVCTDAIQQTINYYTRP